MRKLSDIVHRQCLWTGLIIVCLLMTACQAIIEYAYFPRDTRPAEYAVNVTTERMITSDGIELVADVYQARTGKPNPTILVRIPFFEYLLES